MKLIFVIPTSYPNKDNPVANSFIQETVSGLVNLGNDKYVILNVIKQPSRLFFKKMDKSINFDFDNVSDVIRIKCRTIFEKRLPIFNFLLFQSKLKKIFKTAVEKYGKPDLIFSHFYKAAFSSWLLAKRFNTPIVTMEHSGELMGKKIPFFDKYSLKKAVSKSSAYICTNENLLNNVSKKTGLVKNLIRIPNSVNEIFDYHSVPNNQKFTFSCVSRLEFDKRVDLLVNAFCSVFSSEDPVCLKIGGSGPEYKSIQSLIKSNNRENQISLLGPLSRIQTADLMKQSNAFVLPSRHETFGLVWREALCCGRPVITTNHGGFSDLDWKDDYGIMINVDDQLELQQSLKKMRDNYSFYNFEQISYENKQLYSQTIVANKINTVFERIIK